MSSRASRSAVTPARNSPLIPVKVSGAGFNSERGRERIPSTRSARTPNSIVPSLTTITLFRSESPAAGSSKKRRRSTMEMILPRTLVIPRTKEGVQNKGVKSARGSVAATKERSMA